jgi:hypothetical protein
MEIYIAEIAEKLWSGHASLMVGAGFSRNAKKSEVTAKGFPLWNDLGDIFFQKLYSKEPTTAEKSYLDVSKLANEVEAACDRSTLDEILRDEIPDSEYDPSELHEKLLQLPWIDVFTTNYDTLLERTAEKIFERRYETVVNKKDLVLSTKPRIIKLHGSFSSERPFTITEEDYRKYPREYAPFVNTVQQSLLENTLCIVGFSGNDPNFQKWIGWIRDNLGKANSPKIFLIGSFSLTAGQEKLLAARNVIPIDLSFYSKEQYDALNEFIDKIHEFKQEGDKSDWGNEIVEDEKDNNDKIDDIIKRWKQKRQSYPDWLILPSHKRDILRHDTKIILNKINKDKNKKEDAESSIEFLYELNWRQEKCLRPINNDWIETYEKIIERYNPFPSVLQTENANTPQNNKSLDWKSISQYWVELQLSLLRFYREEGFNEKWILLAEKVNFIKQALPSEMSAKYSYERCLYKLFILDICGVRDELRSWKTDETLPYWEAKRASLMAELGDVEDAEKILDLSLIEIRNRLRLSPVKNDYSLVSQEAYLLQLANCIKTSLVFPYLNLKKKEDEKYSKRGDELKQYQCDPWNERRTFDFYLKVEPPENNIEKKYNFDGSETIIYHSTPDAFSFQSYSYLRFFEEVGMPYKLPYVNCISESFKNAILHVAKCLPNWGVVAFVRTGDDKIINRIFNKKNTLKISQETCDLWVVNYLDILNRYAKEAKNDNRYNNDTFASSLSTSIPKLLSVLSMKCSYEIKHKILLFVKELYCSDAKTRSKYKIDKLVKLLMESFPPKELYSLLPELLKFPIIDEKTYPDVFDFIQWDGFQSSDEIKIDVKIVDELISFLSNGNSKRKTAVTRLAHLWQVGLLTIEQQTNFGIALWSITNDDGFPKEISYRNYCYMLKLPHPNTINPHEILREYINTHPMPSVEEQNGIALYHGYRDQHFIFKNIAATSELKYQWSREEINALLLKIANYWNINKGYFGKMYSGNFEEDPFLRKSTDKVKSIIDEITNVFTEVISPNINLIDEKSHSQIRKLLSELSEYDIPDLKAKSAFVGIFPNSKEELCKGIQKQLYSNKEMYVKDAIDALLCLIKQNNDSKFLIEDISKNIRVRTKNHLNKFIDAMRMILKNQNHLLTDKILDDIDVGLSYLIDEVKIERNDTDEWVHNKLLLKQDASYLLIWLKQYYEEVLKEKVPQYITNWKTMCLDINEFADIRNIWLNKKS